MITMTMRYTPENLQRAFSLHYNKLNPVRGKILLILGAMLLWAGALLWILYRNQDQRVIQYVYIVAGLLLVGIHWFFMSRLGKTTFKRMRSPQGSFVFRIDEKQIEMVTPGSTKAFEWDNVERAIVQPDVLLVYIAKQQFYFFPKENFESTEDFEAVKALVEAKAGKVIK